MPGSLISPLRVNRVSRLVWSISLSRSIVPYPYRATQSHHASFPAAHSTQAFRPLTASGDSGSGFVPTSSVVPTLSMSAK